MSSFILSGPAESDLLEIGEYTLHHWGEQQAERYLAGLEAFCRLPADNPLLGRSCEDVRPGVRRMEHREHVVFYRMEPKGIYVVRILHRGMLPGSHAF